MTMSEYIGNEQNGASVGLVEKQTFIFAQPPDSLALEGGADIGPVTLAYETCGTINSQCGTATPPQWHVVLR